MDKMKMQSTDITAQNIEKIGAIFPNCITEMLDKENSTAENKVYKKAINFELLKQMLSKDVVEGKEAYEFTWVGKKASIIEANKPIRKTLRPCKDESTNWDNTQNLYIEGDNLEVLKLLQESYLGKVKMIYIDPPYNTGSDFIYNDDFKMSSDEYANKSGEVDEVGNRMFKNTDSNGRFHSDWCSMIYPRLLLARNLLSDDGVIFISIDDNEQANLKKICDEIFGIQNFVGDFIRKTKSTTNDAKTGLNYQHEFLICYSKNINFVNLLGGQKDLSNYKNPDDDPNGAWISDNPSAKSGTIENGYFAITNPYTGKVDYPPKGMFWRFSQKTIQKHIDSGRICFKKEHKENERGFIYKRYLKDLKTTQKTFDSLKFTDNEFMNQNATKGLLDLGLGEYFTYPKGVNFIQEIIEHATNSADRNPKFEPDIILDFFSGSASTAHAVMQLNAQDGGNRKFIMVQLPEKTDKTSQAYKAGYKNICEIGKERIRRAGKKIFEENKDKEGIENLDIGFRVLKLDDTNMRDIYYSPSEYSQDLLFKLDSNVKSDRSDLDLLFGCLLEWGLSLSLPYTCENIEGCAIHNYNDGDLIACFDENISENAVIQIAKQRPLRAVFRDTSFANSPSKINIKEIFKLLSPNTRVKVI